MVIRPTKPTAGELKAKAIGTPERGVQKSAPSDTLDGLDGLAEGDPPLSPIPAPVPSLIGDLERYLTDYVILPPHTSTVIALWIMASWICDVWDKFPHLGIYSPEKGCGKTTLLESLRFIARNPKLSAGMSVASMFRLIQASGDNKPTIILEEAQSLNRNKSESGEAIRELLNAGIERNSQFTRCVPSKKEGYKVEEFSIYSPKIYAHIGAPDSVLADRSLTIEMTRKLPTEKVERWYSRDVQARAEPLKKRIDEWIKERKPRAESIYATIRPFDMCNARMADLLLPLLTILRADLDEEREETLLAYANGLDERDKEIESQTTGIKLLTACREVFEEDNDTPFFKSEDLVGSLIAREDEEWGYGKYGQALNQHTLANLLSPYKIKPRRDTKGKCRGYYVKEFADTFNRYLPVLEKPAEPVKVRGLRRREES